MKLVLPFKCIAQSNDITFCHYFTLYFINRDNVLDDDTKEEVDVSIFIIKNEFHLKDG